MYYVESAYFQFFSPLDKIATRLTVLLIWTDGKKPIVAAMEGLALGAGLEIAMVRGFVIVIYFEIVFSLIYFR